MLNKNRTELVILGDILSVAENKAKKIQLLCRANLNYIQLQNYLAFLLDRGLLEEHNDPNKGYKTTRKGLEFLALSKKLQSFLE